MAFVETPYKHVVLDDDRVPLIAGTTMKVEELVLVQQANSWNPEELAYQFPYLKLGQIRSALAYYWAHKVQIDEDIETGLRYVEVLRARSPEPPIVARLRALRDRQ